jgi:ketosteroid isomerase-like protein
LAVDAGMSLERLDAQEDRFSAAFAAGDVSLAHDMYDPDVVYVSPTTRLFGVPRSVEGIDATLDFIQLTITSCRNISYRPRERAVLPGGQSAYVLVDFDWDAGDERLRSRYVVVYRYRDGRIRRQELYYDPSGPLERVGEAAR